MDKLKWVCDYNPCDGTNLSFEKDRAFGFSWPQRNYRCSFCKKEFKSAQALGGHMNVHRRDRARLRLSPSWDSPNPNPNPSFALSSTPPIAKFVPYSSFVMNSFEEKAVVPANDRPGRDVVARSRGEMGKKNEGTRVDFSRRKDARVWKANELIRLDLNLGLFQDANEDLDLELRLGSS